MREPTVSHSGFFAVSDSSGDFSKKFHGFYGWDTRFLSQLSLRIEGSKPKLLSCISLTSWHIVFWVEKDGIIIARDRVIDKDGTLIESFSLPQGERDLKLSLSFKVGFESIFEVRGSRRLPRRIKHFNKENSIIYTYSGVDGLTRVLKISLSKGSLQKDSISITLKPGEKAVVRFSPNLSRNPVYMKTPAPHTSLIQSIKTDSEIYSLVLDKSISDLSSLTYYTRYGPVFLAGIPYFACVFGRDSIISALYVLPYYPEYALSTLKLLGELQGRKFDTRKEEEPGKIPHEVRFDELSLAGITPFSTYYGTVDATPLYVILAREYLRWSGDRDGAKTIAPYLKKAVEWILAKIEENGFLTYSPRPGGLVNQGWKDSAEGVPYENGEPVKPPVALVEVQGYACAALQGAAEMADILGLDENYLKEEARALYDRINRYFWMEDRGYYALALDGDGGKSGVLASNQGHLLFATAASRKREIVEKIFSPRLYSGWGIRTLAEGEKAYNPFSYHNGSVWPHDNAFIALGLGKEGFVEKASNLASDLFMAGYLLDGFPELFSGLSRSIGPPCPISRANIPQAWSAASAYAFISSFLSLKVEDDGVKISPLLPPGLNCIKVRVKIWGREEFLKVEKKGEKTQVEGSSRVYYII